MYVTYNTNLQNMASLGKKSIQLGNRGIFHMRHEQDAFGSRTTGSVERYTINGKLNESTSSLSSLDHTPDVTFFPRELHKTISLTSQVMYFYTVCLNE